MIACAALAACSDPVNVVVHAPSAAPGAVLVFDDRDTLRMAGAVDSIHLDPSSEHTCTLPGGSNVPFRIGAKGGLLNLDSNAYVVFSIDYHSAQANTPNPKIVVGYVLIDSFLVYRKPFPSTRLDAADALRIAGNLREQGNFAEVILPMARKSLKSYPTSKEVAGVRWIGPEQRFVERFWDIDPGHDIPSTITGEVQQGFERFDTERSLTAIMEARGFLLLAGSDPEVYDVIDLRTLSATSAADGSAEQAPAR